MDIRFLEAQITNNSVKKTVRNSGAQSSTFFHKTKTTLNLFGLWITCYWSYKFSLLCLFNRFSISNNKKALMIGHVSVDTLYTASKVLSLEIIKYLFLSLSLKFLFGANVLIKINQTIFNFLFSIITSISFNILHI